MAAITTLPLITFVSRLLLVACALVACASAVVGVRAADPQLLSVAYWEQKFINTWEDQHTEEYLGLSTAGDGWKLYDLAYAVDATVAMYRATGDTKYLNRSLLYVNNVIATAKRSADIPTSQYRDEYMAWPSFSHPDGNDNGREYALYESYMWRYVAYMLRTMHDTPVVMQDTIYKADYDKILAFTEENIYGKWYARGADDYIYRQNAHMASHWAYIAMELAAITPDESRKAAYTEVYTNINHKLPNYPGGLRTQLYENPANANAYAFHSDWGVVEQSGSDASHANGVLAYIVEAHDKGVEWTRADIDKFCAMLKDVIWKDDGTFAAFVDGSGTDNGWINDGLMKLGRYDEDIQRHLETYDVAQNMQFYANAALNAKMLEADTNTGAELTVSDGDDGSWRLWPFWK